MGILRRIQHVPQFRLAPLAVFVSSSVSVIRVDLNGKILFGVDKFNENGQLRFTFVPGAQKRWIFLQNLGQGPALPGAAADEAGSVGVGGALPGLRQRGKGQILSEFIL